MAAQPQLRIVLENAADLLIARYLESAGPVVRQLVANYQDLVDRLEADLREVLTILSVARQRQAELTENGLRTQ